MLSNEEILTRKFNSFITKALENELLYRKRGRKNQAKRVVNFSELKKEDENKLYFEDEYDCECFQETITTSMLDATIHDELLHKALLSLKKNNLEIIILKYWGELTDLEIGRALSMSQQMVHYHRNQSLELLKIIIEELRKDD